MTEKDVTITYETLFELLRIEKNREDLQKLENSFYEDVLEYLRQKKIAFESKQSNQRLLFEKDDKEMTRMELENIKKILKDLYDRREKKVVLTAISRSRAGASLVNTANMLPGEKGLFEELSSTLGVFRKNILYKLVCYELPKIENGTSRSRYVGCEEDKPEGSSIADLSQGADIQGTEMQGPEVQNTENTPGEYGSAEDEQPVGAEGPDMHFNTSQDLGNYSSDNQTNSESVAHAQESTTGVLAQESEHLMGGESRSLSETKELKSTPNSFENGEKSIKVRFLAEIDEIVGPDLQIYGPYDKGAQIALPNELARVLIDKGQAERF